MNENRSQTKNLVFRLLKPATDENAGEEGTIAEVPTTPNDCLESGFILPVSYRKGFSKSLFGLPINEIDEYYKNRKTFVVIGSNWEIHRFSSEKSLGFLDVFSWVRWISIRAVSHALFRFLMVITMLLYLLIWPNHLTRIFRIVYLIVFNLEMNLKLIAFGVARHPFSYFRNLWNWLDLLIIAIMTIQMNLLEFMSISSPQLDAIESLRILKLIQLFPLARLSLKSAFKSIFILKDLMITFLFVYLVSILFALNAYSGIYRSRCQPDPVDWSSNATAVQDEFTYLCGNVTGSMPCQANYTCVSDRGENPDQGYTNFDNFGYAAFSVFRLLLKDYWESLYNDTHRSWGFYPIFYFLSLIFINLLFNNLFASYIAIGAAKFFRQLNAIESNNPKEENSSALSTTHAADIFPSEDNTGSELSNVEFNVVATQPTTSNDNNESEKDENPSKLSKIWNSLVNFVWGWNCCQRCYCQKQMEAFLYHRYFEWYINVVIAITLAIELFIHNQMPATVEIVFHYLALVIDGLYFLEVTLKIIALTPKQFFNNGWNQLDFFIVLFGILVMGIDLIVVPLRFVRALRYMKSWKKGSSIFKVHKVSVWMIFIVMLTLAHIGTSLFDYHYYNLPHRWNFQINFKSFLAVFRAFAGEWVETLLPLIAVADHPWLVYIFFLVVIISSYILITNVFLLLVHTILETDSIFDTDHHYIANENSPGILSRIVDCLRRTKDTKMTIENGEQTDTNEENRAETNGVHDVNQDHQHPSSDDENPPPCCWNWWNRRTSFQPLSTSERTSCWSSFRKRALIWSHNNIWRGFITTIIVLSCIPYILPIPFVHTYTNYVITGIFIFEIALQITGEGIKTYFGNCWTRFDFFVTSIHLLLNAFHGSNALRILRLVVRLEDQKAVVKALFYRKAILLEAITITNFVWLLFAIQGTHIFQGRQNVFCQNNSGDILWEMAIENCTGENLTAFRHTVNFDNVVNGLVALLQFATFKGWIGVWHHAEDVGIDKYDAATFFMGFILMGAFVCLAIIVSSLIIKHNAHRKEIGGRGYIEILMTVEQRKLLALKRKQWFMTPEKSLSPNEAGYTRIVSRVVSHKLFDLYSIVLLLINALVLGVYSHSPKIEHWSHTFSHYATFVLIAGFVIEVGLQIFVYRKAYFQKSWNVYNFALVIGIILTHFIPDLVKYFVSSIVLLWLLTFRLVRWLKWVKRIVLMVRICMPAISNVANLMATILFFFSITFTQLYMHVNPHQIHSFHNVFSANSVLLEISFFGAWDSVYSAMHAEGQLAAMFIINYLIICFLIFLTAGTVIFMENYYHLNEKLRLGIEDESFENYKKMWQIFDPDGTGSLTFDDLSDFLHYLDPPFQVEKPNDLKITAMQFPVNKDNKVKFSDVLQNLIHHLDKEKKVPKPILEEDEEKAPTSSRLDEIREKASQLHKTRNWCCQKRKSLEENEELTSDH